MIRDGKDQNYFKWWQMLMFWCLRRFWTKTLHGGEVQLVINIETFFFLDLPLFYHVRHYTHKTSIHKNCEDVQGHWSVWILFKKKRLQLCRLVPFTTAVNKSELVGFSTINNFMPIPLFDGFSLNELCSYFYELSSEFIVKKLLS